MLFFDGVKFLKDIIKYTLSPKFNEQGFMRVRVHILLCLGPIKKVFIEHCCMYLSRNFGLILKFDVKQFQKMYTSLMDGMASYKWFRVKLSLFHANFESGLVCIKLRMHYFWTVALIKIGTKSKILRLNMY